MINKTCKKHSESFNHICSIILIHDLRRLCLSLSLCLLCQPLSQRIIVTNDRIWYLLNVLGQKKKVENPLWRVDFFIVFLRLPLSWNRLYPHILFSLLPPILVQRKIPREKIILESQILLNIQPSSTLQVMQRLLSQSPREVLAYRNLCDNGCNLCLGCLYYSCYSHMTTENLKTELH